MKVTSFFLMFELFPELVNREMFRLTRATVSLNLVDRLRDLKNFQDFLSAGDPSRAGFG